MFIIAKRLFYFTLVQTLVMLNWWFFFLLISIFFNIDVRWYSQLLIAYSLFGVLGSFSSLACSKWIARWILNIKTIDPKTEDLTGKELIKIVHHLAKKVELGKSPEIGIYDSSVVNAFSIGPSKNNCLIILSTGLLRTMSKEQVEGVLAHEMSHISNGDMVTMILLQGILNSLFLFITNKLAQIFSTPIRHLAVRRVVYLSLSIGSQIFLGLWSVIVVNYFSRHREFRADRGSDQLMGKNKILSALSTLDQLHLREDHQHPFLNSLAINGDDRTHWLLPFSTHPRISERIHRIKRIN